MASTNKDRRACGVIKYKHHRCHQIFLWVLLLTILMNNLVLGEREPLSSSPSEDNESMWYFFTNQFFRNDPSRYLDREKLSAKLAHFTNNEESNAGTDFLPADEYRDVLGLKAHFPVALIPGITSSLIESWSTNEKFKKYYRKPIWGTYNMFRILMKNKSAWYELLKLGPNGLDPEGIKLRAIEGFDSTDYFVPGYWVWSKVIENLSAIGYDPNNMYMASYDWRLSLGLLEHRDQYFSKLKDRIELNKRIYGRRTVMIGHSMGSTVLHYFLKWAESTQGGNGGKQWTETHVESVVHIGGTLLGTPKALAFLLTGEARELKSMGKMKVAFLERLLCRGQRVEMIRNWGGPSATIPKGGNKIWGDFDGAPDDINNMGGQPSFGEYISFLPGGTTESNDNNTTLPSSSLSPLFINHTLDSTINLMGTMASPEYLSLLHNNYSFGITTSKKQLEANDDIPRKWTNPLESKLPIAPSTTIYSLYGVGATTERSYYFTTPDMTNIPTEEDKCNVYANASTISGTSIPIPMVIDSSISDPVRNIQVGIRLTDGDATVPTFSNGFMSSPLGGGWTDHADLYNPGHSQVIAREYQHKITKGSALNRGAPTSAKHVELLGNAELLLDLLQIVSNRSENVTERLYSNIETMAQQVSLDHQA